jgi:hypothetical protein
MRTFPLSIVALVVISVLATGCSQDQTKTPGTTTSASPSGVATPGAGQPGAATPGTGPAGATPSKAVSQTWSSGPVTVVHQPSVPPISVVTAIRYAGHPAEGFDRIVFDIRGALPGYSARYVTQVRADGSDQPISVPGRSFLMIVLNPAQAHTDQGAVTVTGVHRVGLPMLVAYAVAGDFEANVSIALGLNATAGYRISELPGRIYVDVAT